MYLAVKQAAEILQVSKRTILRRIGYGTIQAIRLGNRTIRIDEDELTRYVEKSKGRAYRINGDSPKCGRDATGDFRCECGKCESEGN